MEGLIALVNETGTEEGEEEEETDTTHSITLNVNLYSASADTLTDDGYLGGIQLYLSYNSEDSSYTRLETRGASKTASCYDYSVGRQIARHDHLNITIDMASTNLVTPGSALSEHPSCEDDWKGLVYGDKVASVKLGKEETSALMPTIMYMIVTKG